MIKQISWYTLFITTCFFLLSCHTLSVHESRVFGSDKTLHEIWRIVYNTPLEPEKAHAYPDSIEKYFSHYGLDFEGVNHYFGSFRSGEYLIAAHLFMPKFAIETVYLVHGYLLHSGYFNRLISLLLEHNFAVAVFDLPGHGFSSGDSADIRFFYEYGMVIHDFILYTENTFIPPPYAIIGHSAGGSAVIEYMLNYDSVFQRHILSAPLLHSKMWGLSNFGLSILQGSEATIPAHLLDVTSDKEYLKFLEQKEPLRRTRIPLSWVKALVRWNKYLGLIDRTLDHELLVLQGKNDTIVDWKYNMQFITNLFPDTDVIYFDDAKHELFQERNEIREQVFELILEELEQREY